MSTMLQTQRHGHADGDQQTERETAGAGDDEKRVLVNIHVAPAPSVGNDKTQCEAVVTLGAYRLHHRRTHARFGREALDETTHPDDVWIVARLIDDAPFAN